jgi:hypothetical protein
VHHVLHVHTHKIVALVGCIDIGGALLDEIYCKKSMQRFVVVPQVLGLSWARHIGRGSFGPLLCLTLTP